MQNKTVLLTSSNTREPEAKCINANKNIGVNTTNQSFKKNNSMLHSVRNLFK